jgi:hypothetical protein
MPKHLISASRRGVFIIILELQNNAATAAVGLTTPESGAARVRKTPLLTVEGLARRSKSKCGTVHRGSGVEMFARKEHVCV